MSADRLLLNWGSPGCGSVPKVGKKWDLVPFVSLGCLRGDKPRTPLASNARPRTIACMVSVWSTMVAAYL